MGKGGAVVVSLIILSGTNEYMTLKLTAESADTEIVRLTT